MNKKTLFIHIGRPKAGSSSLQKFLAVNSDTLEKHGCQYIRDEQQLASHSYPMVFLPNAVGAQALKDIEPDTLYAELKARVFASNASNTIISSEYFWLLAPEKLPDFGTDINVKIIAYIRRQDDALVSGLVQEIKGGKIPIDVDIEEYINQEQRLHYLDYYRILTQWADIFGQENIIVRPFERTLAETSLETDLLNILGLENSAAFKIDKQARNSSPALDILELISDVHRFPIGEIPKLNMAGMLSQVSDAMAKDSNLNSQQLLSPKHRRQVIKHFRHSNEKLSTQFLNIRPEELFPPFEENQTKTAQYPGVSLMRLKEIVTGTLALQQQTLFRLTCRANQQDRRIAELETLLAKLDSEQH